MSMINDIDWKKVDLIFQYSLNIDEKKITIRDSLLWITEKNLIELNWALFIFLHVHTLIQ